MIRIFILYTLLLASMAFPPLLLISLPLLFLWIRSVRRQRRMLLGLLDQYHADQTRKDIIRTFR